MKQHIPEIKSKAQPGNPTLAYESQFQLNNRLHNQALRLLSEEQWLFWKTNGYIIIPQAVPATNVSATAELIWEFEGKDPENPETWYSKERKEHQMKELKNSGMVELYNHQALWDNRQSETIYNAFADIWGTDNLWVTIDRVNLNLPIRPGHEFKGFIHWDIDTSLPVRPVNVQGVLALSDTDDDTGGFQCIPELYRNFDEWKKTQPIDRDPFKPNIEGFKIEKVNMKAGDLLIFNSMLAHGIRPNHSNRPRLAQYISMSPAEEERDELKKWRIQSWKQRIAPEGYAFPGDPRNWEQQHAKTADLTDLGKKLLGVERW